MLLKHFVAALASAAFTNAGGPCCGKETFGLEMGVYGNGESPWVPLQAIDTGDEVNLVAFEGPGWGTSACSTGVNPTRDIFLDFGRPDDVDKDSVYALYVFSAGLNYGGAFQVAGLKDDRYTNWSIMNTTGEIQPQRSAALQMWWACNITVSGSEYQALSWGVMYSNGTFPEGCVPSNFRRTI